MKDITIHDLLVRHRDRFISFVLLALLYVCICSIDILVPLMLKALFEILDAEIFLLIIILVGFRRNCCTAS